MVEMTGSEFIVKFDGLELPADVQGRIAAEIQAAVLREIAQLDLRGDLVATIPRRDWIGIWLRSQKMEKNVVFRTQAVNR